MQQTRTIATLLRGTLLLALGLLLSSCNEAQLREGLGQLTNTLGSGSTGSVVPLSTAEIGAGLKEALRVGSERVVGQLGASDGFNGDAAVRILLPEKLAKARAKAAKFGLDGVFVDLEVRFNRAAEAAAPKAKAIFWQAIAEMTLEDVRAILQGQNDAATRYFQRKMTPALTAALRPVVDDCLDQVGAVRVYRQLGDQLKAIPFAPQIDTDLSGHVVRKALDGLFLYLAREEAAIRRNPAKRTSELLRRVFSESARLQ